MPERIGEQFLNEKYQDLQKSPEVEVVTESHERRTGEKQEAKEKLQKEFDDSLTQYFEEVLQNNPPIDGKFYPDVKLFLENNPKEKRNKTLVIFKENLAKQREGLADCRVFIEKSIEFDNDVPKEKLMALVEKFGEKYSFTDEQKQTIEKLIDGYFDNHSKVLEVRKQYPDDLDLIDHLIGRKLDRSKIGKMEISVGPMTIDIEADNNITALLHSKSKNPITAPLGFVGRSSGENPIYYVVINQDEELRIEDIDDLTGEKTKKHEYEHVKNNMFKAVFESQVDEAKIIDLRDKYQGAKFYQEGGSFNSDEPLFESKEYYEGLNKENILEDYLKIERDIALRRVKNEIIASLYTESIEALKSKDELEDMFLNEQGSYDYFKYPRKKIYGYLDEKGREIWKKVLGEEYISVIKKGVESFADLINRGYSKEKAIAILTDKDLQDWPKTINRLLQNKSIKQERIGEDESAKQKVEKIIEIKNKTLS